MARAAAVGAAGEQVAVTAPSKIAAALLDVAVMRKAVPARGGPRTVIADLRFNLAEREIVALVGPSGCGKTTLLRIIGGLDAVYDGRIAWAAGAPPRIGTVFQEPRLLPWRTVRQNIALVRPPDPGVAAGLLALLGLTPFADLYPPALSLGMARRAAIARAFAIEPALLLLDEPFVSLDPGMAEQGRAVLAAAWQARSCAALLVTHDLAEAASLADRILLLSAGPARVLREVVVPEASRRRGIAEGARVAAGLT
jgi:ABC-type nitrate/sulfonate/bicarbonate transport system ATPase subunit